MENNLLLKRKIFAVLISIIFFSCTKDKKTNSFYDKVEYYHSDYYRIAGPPDGINRFDVYYSDFVEKNSKIHYKDLSEFGFIKSEINNEFSEKIDNFFTDQNPGRYYPDYKCLNCYQDVLLFYKNNELIGIAKFDFKCDKYCYSNFESNKDRYLRKDCLQYKYLFR
ncbi:hypothetical protein [Flavobacterium sp. SLB02]|uniref:hypothetical protein n=1 Tax=Flavobacterium sp. SLB02 TaxID=2665645 RepID=UPI0012A9A743|nr:hypothetical protein [Flavobacterium sp. SLB02]QGK73059.1 hypothetical protein GIY83_02945 [Flavobacterium sp. SLB02]